MKTVWIYVDTSKDVGDRDYLKVFESEAAADEWLTENDSEGVAFEYDVLRCLVWVINGPDGPEVQLPLYP
jgi:hypothetical protein